VFYQHIQRDEYMNENKNVYTWISIFTNIDLNMHMHMFTFIQTDRQTVRQTYMHAHACILHAYMVIDT